MNARIMVTKTRTGTPKRAKAVPGSPLMVSTGSSNSPFTKVVTARVIPSSSSS